MLFTKQVAIAGYCSHNVEIMKKNCTSLRSGFAWVLESPGILLWHFPGLESPAKGPLVLESSGNLLNSAKKNEVYGRR